MERTVISLVYFQTWALDFDQVIVNVYLEKQWKDIFQISYDPDAYLGSCQKQSSRGVCKKGVLKNFAKFTEKHLCQSLFFNKVRPATLLKKRLWHRCFPVNFAKFSRTHFFIEHLRWLLLSCQTSMMKLLCEISFCLTTPSQILHRS